MLPRAVAGGLVEDQDLGAGISCATSGSPRAATAGCVHLTACCCDPRSLLSSRGRMMAVVAPTSSTRSPSRRVDVECSVLGEVTGDGRLVIDWHGERIVDVDPRTVAHDGPVYERPIARPAWIDALGADTASALPRPEDGPALREQLLAVTASPNLADPSWITDQYDHYVLGNTALASPDAGMVRIDGPPGSALSRRTRTGASASSARRGRADQPRRGLPQRRARGGAAAVSDRLFGSPENPEVMWQFQQAVTASRTAASARIPVTGGNVSFYNQTGDVRPLTMIALGLSTTSPGAFRLAGRRAQPLPARGHAARARRLGVGRDRPRPPRRAPADPRPRRRAAPRGAAARGGTGGAARLGARPLRRRPRAGARGRRDALRRRRAGVARGADGAGRRRRGDGAVQRVDRPGPRERAADEDVRFLGLCAGREVPVLRIGVTDRTRCSRCRGGSRCPWRSCGRRGDARAGVRVVRGRAGPAGSPRDSLHAPNCLHFRQMCTRKWRHFVEMGNSGARRGGGPRTPARSSSARRLVVGAALLSPLEDLPRRAPAGHRRHLPQCLGSAGRRRQPGR